MGKNFLPMKDREFVVRLVGTLIHGLAPTVEKATAAVNPAH
jgi:hypothetical protein